MKCSNTCNILYWWIYWKFYEWYCRNPYPISSQLKHMCVNYMSKGTMTPLWITIYFWVMSIINQCLNLIYIPKGWPKLYWKTCVTIVYYVFGTTKNRAKLSKNNWATFIIDNLFSPIKYSTKWIKFISLSTNFIIVLYLKVLPFIV